MNPNECAESSEWSAGQSANTGPKSGGPSSPTGSEPVMLRVNDIT
jgi:hypothetical protein